MNWPEIHDNLLKNDLKNHSNIRIAIYSLIGAVAIATCLFNSNRQEIFLAIGGGFLLGLSAEKFASRQIRRIAFELIQRERKK